MELLELLGDMPIVDDTWSYQYGKTEIIYTYTNAQNLIQGTTEGEKA